MKFYSIPYKDKLTIKCEFPSFALVNDGWSDYGHYILFNLVFYKKLDDSYDIGNIKILDSNSSTTKIPEVFEHLEDNFCSLGQSLEFYEELKKHFPDNYSDILKSLNDIALFPDLAIPFKENEGFTKGLLRFGTAEKAYAEAKMMLYDNVRKVNEELHFSYFIQMDGADATHKVDFDFRKSEVLPFRINVIIGKNGTGKTQFLGSLVNSISGVKNKENFQPYNPRFNKVIAISYSLFDDFPKPKETTVFNYKYIGLRTQQEEIISDSTLSEKLKIAFKKIVECDRSDGWFKIVNKIINLKSLGLESGLDITDEWIENLSYQKSKRLSSGQSIMLFILTELIAYIQEESLILFDEPETHLHPSAISQLLKGFYEILETYKSFAIMSTHSPIIIQDIPSKYITIFDREGNFPKVTKLAIECFGENISTITSTVFGIVDIKEMYKFHFEKLMDNWGNDYTPEKINVFFDNKLSFNAQLYLAALEQNSANEKP